MSDKDTQQESNVTDFPNTEHPKTDKAEQADKADNKNAENLSKDTFSFNIDEILARDRLKHEMNEIARRKRSADFQRTMLTAAVVLFALMILMFVSERNPSIYKIDEDTLNVVNQALNAIILLVIPFLLGMIGATARILIATVKPESKGNLLISSGLMATFSWVGIKSGVLISIIAPHLEKTSIPTEHTISTVHDFYTMALVAILVGMFSTNLYLLVSEKVEQITQQVRNQKAIDKKNKKNTTTTRN